MRVRLSNAPGTLLPAGGLAATFCWVGPQGDVEQELSRVPVLGGIATYRGPPPPDAGLRFAVGVEESNTSGCVYRSGPLETVPGPEPQVNDMQVSIVHCPGVALDLGPDPAGPGSMLSTHVEQALPPQLRLARADIEGDGAGRCVVTISGWLQIATRRLPFAHGRTLRLRGSADRGRCVPCVVAQIEGSPIIGGRLADEQRALLDRAIGDGLALQIDAAVRHAAGLRSASFRTDVEPQTHSVSKIRLSGRKGDPPALELNMSWASASGRGAPRG